MSSSTALAVRNLSPSRPIAKPIVATNNPIATKEMASPIASATGPNLCSAAAVPSTIGTSGSTQGDRMDSAPAMKAKRYVVMRAASDQSVETLGACFSKALEKRSSIHSGWVSPTERPTSVWPR